MVSMTSASVKDVEDADLSERVYVDHTQSKTVATTGNTVDSGMISGTPELRLGTCRL